MKRSLLHVCAALAFTLLFVVQSFAQSQPPSPGGAWPFGFVPTQGQWQAAWAGKQDYLGGLPCLTIGCTLSGKLTLAASTTGAAGLNCGAGSTPTSPVNGDLWCTTSGVFARINGSTVPLGGGTGFTVPQGGTGQTTFTANLPLIGNGASAISQGTVTSTNASTLFATASGIPVNGNCASWNSGNLVDAGSACSAVGSGAVSAGSANQLGYYAGAGTTISGLATANNGALITSGGGVPSISSTLPSAVQGNITALGTIGTGIWQGTLIGGTYGGTGVNNGANTVTLNGANLALSHGDNLTLTTTGATNVTLPTSGNIPSSNGTSGGVPYYNTTTTIQSSGLLSANNPVIGGGAGTAPASGTRSGNTTSFATTTGSLTNNNCAAFDVSGNIKDSGQACGAAAAAPALLLTLTASTSSSLTDVGNCGLGGSVGCFTNTYANYQIVLTNIVATTPSTNLGCQIHIWQGSYQTSGYITQFGAQTPTTYIPCYLVGATSGANTLGAPGLNGSFTVNNPSAVAKAVWNGVMNTNNGTVGAPTISVNPMAGYWNTNGAITGFRLCLGTAGGTCAGTIASGTVKIYGLP